MTEEWLRLMAEKSRREAKEYKRLARESEEWAQRFEALLDSGKPESPPDYMALFERYWGALSDLDWGRDCPGGCGQREACCRCEPGQGEEE